MKFRKGDRVQYHSDIFRVTKLFGTVIHETSENRVLVDWGPGEGKINTMKENIKLLDKSYVKKIQENYLI